MFRQSGATPDSTTPSLVGSCLPLQQEYLAPQKGNNVQRLIGHIMTAKPKIREVFTVFFSNIAHCICHVCNLWKYVHHLRFYWLKVGLMRYWSLRFLTSRTIPPALNLRFDNAVINSKVSSSNSCFSLQIRGLTAMGSTVHPLNVYTGQNPRWHFVSIKTSQMHTICTLITKESCLLVYIFTSAFILGWSIFVDIYFHKHWQS